MKKSNIVLCGLNDKFNLNVAKILSDELDMFLLDLKKLLEYEIASDDVIEKVGIEYLQKLELSALKRAASFENTVIVADYDSFMFDNHFKMFEEKSIIIFLKISKDALEKAENRSTLNLLNFFSRSKELENISDIKIDVSNLTHEETINIIINKLKEELL